MFGHNLNVISLEGLRRMITVDYNAVIAWATLIGVVVAIWAVIAENKRSRFALGVDLIMKLDDRFNSDKMRKSRRSAAISLLNGTNNDATEVLDFFETIGYFIRRGAIDKKRHGKYSFIGQIITGILQKSISNVKEKAILRFGKIFHICIQCLWQLKSVNDAVRIPTSFLQRKKLLVFLMMKQN